ncbi:MAG: hypothetical protein ABIJ09_00565 [Pseudomonadota bacterium]
MTAALAACGPASLGDPCGLGTRLPDLAAGHASYSRDGVVHQSDEGGYKLDFPHDLVMGRLTLNAKLDDEGQPVKARIESGSFPICVPLDDQGDGSGYALLEDGSVSFSTTAQHSGTLSLLALDGDLLLGRFAFDAVQNAGSTTIQITDGAFRLKPR